MDEKDKKIRARLNSTIGGLKRKFKMKRDDTVEPGTFINKINQPKKETKELPKNSKLRTSIMGLI